MGPGLTSYEKTWYERRSRSIGISNYPNQNVARTSSDQSNRPGIIKTMFLYHDSSRKGGNTTQDAQPLQEIHCSYNDIKHIGLWS